MLHFSLLLGWHVRGAGRAEPSASPSPPVLGPGRRGRMPLRGDPRAARNEIQGAIKLWEHMFVQSKGSLHAVFQRAVERGNLLSAETAARQLGRLALADALKLTLLIGEEEPERFPQ